jgi:hypothetical protein
MIDSVMMIFAFVQRLNKRTNISLISMGGFESHYCLSAMCDMIVALHLQLDGAVLLAARIA